MSQSHITDKYLVSQYLKGDEKAFELLINRHKNRLYTTIYLVVKDQHTAEDILQEVFIKAIKKLKSGKYNEEGKFLPWISRVAHNMAIDYFRKIKRLPVTVSEEGYSLFDQLVFTENRGAENTNSNYTANIRELVQQLPEPQKEVLIMRHYLEMSFQDIAQMTGVSINTALGRMRYALINLKKQILLNEDKNEHKSQRLDR
ncbi:RNA polymerase sigma factor [Flammeovirgaceae bacterium SG7u.111]|nr:RNA polymerase sigma factor [Flammeovirgaceae bacterium SG7u.132]WPO35919.1 RNA polymerase sigma factor [Flammeovirgaceae bacterium SG7u.111]